MVASLESALVVLYYAYPATVLLYYAAASLLSACSLHAFKKAANSELKRPKTLAVVCLFALLLTTFIGQLASVITHAILHREWAVQDHVIISHLSCILVFGIELSQLLEADYLTSYPDIGCWILAFLFESVIIGLSAASLHLGKQHPYEIIDVVLVTLRCLTLLLLVLLFRVSFSVTEKTATDEERQSLLPKTTDANGTAGGYGGTTQTGESSEDSSEETPEYNWERREREAKEAMKKRLEEGGNWFEYAKGFKILFPYVWPVGNLGLQLRAAAVCLCLFGSNALHLLIPRQTGIIMDSLGGSNSANTWMAVVIFAALRLAASESGIELVRQWLWIPVKYYSHDALTRAAYSHMMHLSADFHDSKSSSDMMMAIYGGSAVSNVIENVLLYAVPMLIDMGVAVVYLSITFGPYEGLITVACGIFFLLIASRLVSNSKSASRNRVNALYEEHYIRQSGFLGWQTVSAFNQIGYEDNRHANAVTNRWLREQQYALGWYISIGFQTLVLTSGLLASAFLAVYRIRVGHATPGQFAMLLMYWAQLTSPLQFFAKLGKSISDDFIDAERLLDIMRTKPSVENQKGARPLKFLAGEVEFDAVCFSYDKQKGIIKDVSFQVPAGQTVAFVGATGAGKSTLLKLLDRFYDVTGGAIRIDGQDIREVDLSSLRDRIGVVPQNPILFDDTIINNVRYGRITATDDEVYEACEAACIHDKIKGFTHGYKTRVGERGVKLSGGELQRIAIARAMLKKPDIVLLDEATSAVDTDTEQQIQVSFKRLCQGRTTFIVAHRLSTIMNADRIIVVENGEIQEQGSHNELIVAEGRYADLWSKQVFVRPSDDGKGATDSTGQTGIVNDLSSEQTRTELSKVKPTSTKENEESSSRPEGSSEAVSQPNGHKNGDIATPKPKTDSSKLNPIAATFTPRSLGKPKRPAINTSTDSEDTMSKDTTKATTPQTSSQWSDEVATQDEQQVKATTTDQEQQDVPKQNGSRPKVKKVDRQKAFTEAVDRALKNGTRAEGSANMEALPKPVEADAVVELKYPRYSRRVQSKSEPSHASQDSEAAEDEPVLLADVAEEPPTIAHRRVSAPVNVNHKNIEAPVPSPIENHQESLGQGKPSAIRASQLKKSTTRPSLGFSAPTKQETNHRGNITKATRLANKSVSASTENDYPSQNADATSPSHRQPSRGWKRGKGPWHRNRRGRGNHSGVPPSNL